MASILHQITITLTDDELQDLDRLAKKMGLDREELIQEIILRAIKVMRGMG